MLTLPILGTESPTPVADFFDGPQNGAPKLHFPTARKLVLIDGATHIRVKLTVTQWDLQYDMPVMVELWGNALRRRRNGFIGFTNFTETAQQTLNQEGLDINNNLLTSRDTLR